jgi:hypothetical protein
VVREPHQFFSLSFRGSCLVSSSLSEVWLVLRFRRSALWPTSHPALELGFCSVCLLGAYFFSSCPFSGARSEIFLLSVCYAGFLFFNFATSFAFGCCSLAQEMSFVDHYLPYFRQHLITSPLSAVLSFQPLFTECVEISSLPSPLLQCT